MQVGLTFHLMLHIVTSFQATVHWFKSCTFTYISQHILNLGAHYYNTRLAFDSCTDEYI